MEAALQRKNTRGHNSAGTPQRNARQMMIEVKETGVSIYIDHHVRVCRLGLLLVFHRVLLEGLCNNELEVLCNNLWFQDTAKTMGEAKKAAARDARKREYELKDILRKWDFDHSGGLKVAHKPGTNIHKLLIL